MKLRVADERPGLLAKGEGLSAKVLFVYGAVQTGLSPTTGLLLLNCCCMLLTFAAFLMTNFDKSHYDSWHPIGLHIVPGVWAALVVYGQASLIPAAWLMTVGVHANGV